MNATPAKMLGPGPQPRISENIRGQTMHVGGMGMQKGPIAWRAREIFSGPAVAPACPTKGFGRSNAHSVWDFRIRF